MTRLLCFDVESTGIDTENDRIIQAFLGLMEPDGAGWSISQTWLLNPGVEIPAEAAAVHGYTTERIRAEGNTDTAWAFEQMRSIIQFETDEGAMLCAFNGAFDASFLNAELRRHRMPELVYGENGIKVFDPYVVDRAIDKWRKGSRKLVAVAPVYGVPVEADAHDAGADCLMTGRVALKLLQHPTLGGRTAADLHNLQIGWHAEQARSLQDYLRSPRNKNGADPNAYCDPSWPVYTNERKAA